MRQPLSNVTLNELLNANYEALKAVTSSYLAKLASPEDALAANRIFHAIAEEIDDARTDFIMVMRESAPEVEGEIVEDDELEDVRAQSEESLQ
jgi:phosphosulfolactate phosphohydrolase-like enzyme